jgi:putative ABC transport system ATP-binding protein
MPVLLAQGLKKYYGTEPNIVRAIDGVDIEVEAGEFVAVVGASGSGKSTLLHMLGGLDKPTDGKVVIDGHDISQMSDEQLTIFRRRNVGFVFQSYNLVPILTIYENIVLPVELDGNTVDKPFIDEIIDMLGLGEKRDSFPGMLSGGQQQRVAIARAIAAKPSILLADEPTGNLDRKTSLDVLGVLKMTSDKFHQTMMMITHNEHIAQLADRIIHLEDGKIVREGRSRL